MPWLNSVVLWFGIFDAGTMVTVGFVAAMITVFGLNMQKFWDRVWPAVWLLVGSNIAAVLMLWMTSKLLQWVH